MRLSYKPFTVCSVVGCHLLTRSHPMCKYHQYRSDKYGSPTYIKPKKVKDKH